MKTRHFKLLFMLIACAVLLAACKTGEIREKLLTVPTIEGAEYVGASVCVECHEEAGESLAESVHGRLASFELLGAHGGCESCHGPGSLHVETEDASKILTINDLDPDEVGGLCVKCHSGGDVMEWGFSGHAMADVSCTDCHTLHGESGLKKSEPELCYGCHAEQKAKANFPSHHPVAEGKMTCSDCHNPHGDLIKADTINDLCLDCHSRYQGPFVFEHAPVQEGCTVCHDAHGTVANNLLKQNEPFLCLQCHESHFHTARVGSTLSNPEVANPGLAFDANKLPSAPAVGEAPNNAAGTGIEFSNKHGEAGWRKAFGTKCSVCHSQLHGSDLPSQSAPTTNAAGDNGWPGGGAGLTR